MENTGQKTHKIKELGPETGLSKATTKKAPPILQSGHPILHTPAKEVIFSEITSPEIQKIIKDMIMAMESEEDGIGLAAPQIGVPLRIFIVAGFIFDRMKAAEILAKSTDNAALAEKKKSDSGVTMENESIITEETRIDDDEEMLRRAEAMLGKNKSPHQVFINPIIVKKSKEERWMDGEGCLSVRWFYGKVKRSTRVTLRAYNEKGDVCERGASGILAHIFQHEVDHLDGILFTDKAKDIQEFDPEEIRAEARQAREAREKKNK